MNKFFEKIRYSIFGERLLVEKCDLVMKNKQIDDYQKLPIILTYYKEYYKYNHDSYVKLMCYELYYENFMIDYTTKDENAFKMIYKICNDEVNQTNMISLLRNIKTLDLDISKVSDEQLSLIKLVNCFYYDVFGSDMYTPVVVDELIENRINYYSNEIIKQITTNNYFMPIEYIEPAKNIKLFTL